MTLEDRMKGYEKEKGPERCSKESFVAARLDGKAFHTWTRGLERPFDVFFQAIMQKTARELLKQTGASVSYNQSDEITLIWEPCGDESQIYMDGRVFKMVSVLASMATAHFNQLVSKFLPKKEGNLALFDCRVWELPTEEEAINCLIWREVDAVRNSILSLGQAHFSHKTLHGVKTPELLEMLKKIGIYWHWLPRNLQRGSYSHKIRVVKKFDTDELERLPPGHEARKNPDLEVERWEISSPLSLGRLVETQNRGDVIFRGARAIEKDPSSLNE